MKGFIEFLTEDRIDTKNFNLVSLYVELNRKFFGGNLPLIRVEFKKLTDSGGRAKVQRNLRTGEVVPGSLVIEIDRRNFKHESLVGLMLHEMIHIYFYVNGHYRVGHGGEFESMRKSLEAKSGIPIPLTDSPDEDDYEMKPTGYILYKRLGQERYAVAVYSPLVIEKRLYEIKAYFSGEIGKKFSFVSVFTGEGNHTQKLTTTRDFYGHNFLAKGNRYIVDIGEIMSSVKNRKEHFTLKI